MGSADRWEVRRATYDDVPALAAALARAYFDDPLVSWWFTDERTRLARSARYFDVSLRRVALPHGEVYTTIERAGQASWFRPEEWQSSWREMAPSAPGTVAALRLRTPRFYRSIAALEARHPREPHWYLDGLATDPQYQRMGVASALVRPVLDRCDGDGVPAYLETQKERNVPIYRAFGFETTGEFDLPGGGPHMWLMWREPQRPRA